jgi:Asp-tRNA(Asn)/Glu-tRNA(Gln) amidotransferase A subunit family amidase
MDTVGPMTRTVEDSATLLSAMAGFDPLDPGSANVPLEDFAVNIGKDVSKMKIGVPQEYFYDIISEEVAGAVQAAQEVFLGLGAKVESVSIPSLTHSLAISGTIMLAEAASVHEENLKERASQIGDDVRLRLTQGALLSASDYLKAQRARTEFNKQVNQILQQFDVLLSPTIAVGAPKIDGKTVLVDEAEHPALALMPRLTRPHNICGIPTISIPCGFTREGMPIGLQLAGRAFAEKDIIQAAYAYENATNWSTVRPQL